MIAQFRYRLHQFPEGLFGRPYAAIADERTGHHFLVRPDLAAGSKNQPKSKNTKAHRKANIRRRKLQCGPLFHEISRAAGPPKQATQTGRAPFLSISHIRCSYLRSSTGSARCFEPPSIR